MASDEISASPPLSSSRTIAETIFSTRSGSTGRLRREICSERTTLSPSKGTARALAQGDLRRAHQLVAIKRYAAAVALDHGELAQLHPLEGREAEIAGHAHP